MLYIFRIVVHPSHHDEKEPIPLEMTLTNDFALLELAAPVDLQGGNSTDFKNFGPKLGQNWGQFLGHVFTY